MRAPVEEPPAGVSPRAMARIMGAFEALEGSASSFGQVFVLGRVVDHGDAAATARNILANEGLFRLGFASSVLGVVFHIAWAVLFYYLFRPVSRTLSSLATFIILVGCAMQALTAFFYLSPLLVLQSGQSLSGLNTPQLALALINLNGLAFDIDLAFFGFWCVLAGHLILRSTFMPRISRRALDARWDRLGDVSVAAVGDLCVSGHRYRRGPRRTPAADLANRLRRKPATVEGAGSAVP